MKRKHIFVLLGAELILLVTLILLIDEYPALFSSVLAFPFEQIGVGLRALSMSGSMGNGLSLAIWVGISVAPLIPALRHIGDKRRGGESVALVLLSALIFFVLYAMTNPAMIYSIFPGIGAAILPVMKAIMGSVVWSMAVLCVILRLLRLFRSGDTEKLFGYLRMVLYVLCFIFTGAIALSCAASLISALASAQRGLDGLIAVISFIAAALPYAMDIAITLSAINVLDALLTDAAASAGHLAEKLSRLCCISLGVVTASVAGLNLLKLILAPNLSNVAVTVDIPVMSLAFVLAALIVSRLIAENQRLKADNSLFI